MVCASRRAEYIGGFMNDIAKNRRKKELKNLLNELVEMTPRAEPEKFKDEKTNELRSKLLLKRKEL